MDPWNPLERGLTVYCLKEWCIMLPGWNDEGLSFQVWLKNTDSDPHELSDRCVDVPSSLVTDNRVFNGPLGRSSCSLPCMIAPLTPLTCSAALHFATFTLLVRLLRSHTCYAHWLATLMGSQTHFAHSLVGWWKFMNCFQVGSKIFPQIRDEGKFEACIKPERADFRPEGSDEGRRGLGEYLCKQRWMDGL